MGQKVHPYGFRLGYNKTWKSRWFAKKDYADLLHEDLKLKKRLKDQLRAAGVASIEVERPGNKLKVTIFTARPGIIIGRKGAEIDRLRQEIQKRTGREVLPINIQEVHRPELNAQLGGGSDLPATGKTRCLSARHAEIRGLSLAIRLQRNQDSLRWPPERRGNCAVGMVLARPVATAHPAGGYRLRSGRSPYYLRRDRSEVLDL